MSYIFARWNCLSIIIFMRFLKQQKVSLKNTNQNRSYPRWFSLGRRGVFLQKKVPHLALSSLKTENEQSEQKGFVNLLKGVFGTFRKTTARAPKVAWIINEQDALDILSAASLIHRRLDNSIEAQNVSG